MNDQSLTNNPIVQSLTNNPIVLNVKQPLQHGEVVTNLVGFLVSPLDQFAIHPYIPLHMGNFYFSFTNLSLSMLLTLGLVLLLFFVVTKKGGWKVSAKCIAILGRAIL